MRTPNITPAQVLGICTSLGGMAVAFGVLTGSQERVTVAAACAAIGIALKIADAIIRHGRSRSLNGLQAALVSQAAPPASATPTGPPPAQ